MSFVGKLLVKNVITAAGVIMPPEPAVQIEGGSGISVAVSDNPTLGATVVLITSSAATAGGAAPGTPAYNPTWYTLVSTGWYWDPANSTGLASDSNSGASTGAPLLTFAEAIRRFGSVMPELSPGGNCICNQMSAQPSATADPVWLFPVISGGVVA
jgi:hypothetical protein